MSALDSLIDSFVSLASPEKAFKRLQFRMAYDALEKFSGSYRGADQSRLRNTWNPLGGSADQDTLEDLPALRERSRDLIRNDSYAAGIVSTLENNIIGTGIKPQARIDPEKVGISPKKAAKWADEIENNFKKWNCYADSGERLTFYQLQRLVIRQFFENGEAFIVPRYETRKGIPFLFSLQIIESDQINTPFDFAGGVGKFKDKPANVRGGVEIGSRGEPVAYWIQKQHPGDYSFHASNMGRSDKDYTRLPARSIDGRPNLIHLYWQLRPGQTRGVPFLAPTIANFKNLSEYVEAEVVAARIAACFAMAIKRTDAYGSQVGAAPDIDSTGKRIEKIQPGMILYLNEGEDASAINPTRPGTNFDPFIIRMLRAIGAGVGMPYELISKDFSQTTYTSGRMALLEAWREFGAMQDWLNGKLNQPAYDAVLEESYLTGRLNLPNYAEALDAWRSVQWIEPVREWVDPEKEANGVEIALKNNLTTASEEIAARGGDWEQVYAQRAIEIERAKELGIYVDPNPKAVPPADQQSTPDNGGNGNGQASKQADPGGSGDLEGAEGRHDISGGRFLAGVAGGNGNGSH
jgi:lambda family phage portal protein